MGRYAIAYVLLVLAVSGCDGHDKPEQEPAPGVPAVQSPNPDEGNWGSDTLKLDPNLTYRWVKMNNFSMMGRGPIGLYLKLPESAKTESLLSPEMLHDLPEGKRADEYNLPLKITTLAGGVVGVQLIVNEGKDDPDFEAALTNPPAGSSKVVARPWIGLRTEMEGGVAYTMGHPEMLLIVSGGGQTPQAKIEADKACRAIILSVRIDPQAKAVDWFPGAGEETNRPIPPGCEVAMADGMKIRATTKTGTIEIEAGPMSKRSYTWEGATRSVIMDARGERWHGSKGLYYPGPGDHWEEHNGITRGVVEEGQQHFDSVDEAIKWLKERMWMPYVVRDDGLVVGWSKVLERKQLNVEVWQILIKGNKPKKLPGSQNEAIEVLKP